MECLIADISPSKLARIIIHILTMKKLECKSSGSKVILDAAIRILLADDDCAIFPNGLDSEVTNIVNKALSKTEHSRNKGFNAKKTNGITIDPQKTDPQKRAHPEIPLWNAGTNCNKQPRRERKQPGREDQQIVSETKEETGGKFLPSKKLLLHESAPRKMPLLPLPKDTNPPKQQADFLQLQSCRKVLLPVPPPQFKWAEENNTKNKQGHQYQTFYYQHPSVRNSYSRSLNGSHNFADSRLQEIGFQKL